MQKPDKTKQHQQCSVARYRLRVRRPPQALFRQGSMTQGRIYYRLILQLFMLCGTPYFCRVEHMGKSIQSLFIYVRKEMFLEAKDLHLTLDESIT